jgi:hypothetical protein
MASAQVVALSFAFGGIEFDQEQLAKIPGLANAKSIIVYGYAQATNPTLDKTLSLSRARVVANSIKKYNPIATIKYRGMGTVLSKVCSKYLNRCAVIKIQS